MTKICPRCQAPADIQAGWCACGHRFRTQFTVVAPPAPIHRFPWRWVGAGLALPLFLLALANPSRQEYQEWVKREFVRTQQASGNPLGASLAANIGMAMMGNLIEERNFGLGTVFWFQYGDRKSFQVLGIAKQFIPLGPPLQPESQPGPAPMITEPPPRPVDRPFPSLPNSDPGFFQPQPPTLAPSRPGSPGYNLSL